jgi:hypothetical protein
MEAQSRRSSAVSSRVPVPGAPQTSQVGGSPVALVRCLLALRPSLLSTALDLRSLACGVGVGVRPLEARLPAPTRPTSDALPALERVAALGARRQPGLACPAAARCRLLGHGLAVPRVVVPTPLAGPLEIGVVPATVTEPLRARRPRAENDGRAVATVELSATLSAATASPCFQEKRVVIDCFPPLFRVPPCRERSDCGVAT